MKPEEQQGAYGQSPDCTDQDCGLYSGEVGSHWRISRSSFCDLRNARRASLWLLGWGVFEEARAEA